MVRVLKLAKVFDTATGNYIKEFAKVGLWSPKQETDDVTVGVGKTKVGLGWEQPEIELETEGDADFLLAYLGQSAGVRFVGSYEMPDGTTQVREVTITGSIYEFGRPDLELNKKEGGGKPKITARYYKEVLAGTTLFEYDADNDIVVINGTDIMQIHRDNIA